MVSSSLPLTASTASRTSSASSRARLIRPNNPLSAPTLAQSGPFAHARRSTEQVTLQPWQPRHGGVDDGAFLGTVWSVPSLHPREHRLEPVVILLWDRVELVIVAASAVDSDARKSRHRIDDHVVAVQHARLVLLDGPLRQLDVADEVPRPGHDKPRSDDAVRVVGVQYVAGQLFLDESAIQLVP